MHYPRRRAESCNKEFPVKRNVIVGNLYVIFLGIFTILVFKKENIQQMVNISLAKIQNPWSV